MRYFLMLAMFFALVQARMGISTSNVFIDIGSGGHYYKRGYKNHHKDHYRNKSLLQAWLYPKASL